MPCLVPVVFFLAILAAPLAGADILDETLARGGLVRADVGFHPKGWWSRYPRTVPHKLDHFDDLLGEPLAGVTFARTLAGSIALHGTPEAITAEPTTGGAALYRLVHAAIERRFGGLRSYSPNLDDTPIDLVEALLELEHARGRATRLHTFGQDAPYPRPRADLEAQVAALSPALRAVLGRLVADLTDAARWRDLAFRRVPLETLLGAARRTNLAVEGIDALEYAPEVDDVASAWDEASLWYGALKTVEALDRARRALSALPDAGAFAVDFETSLGWVRLRGTGDDTIACDATLVVVDLGGKDRYAGAVAGATMLQPLGVVLDLSGDDVYADSPTRGAQGAAVGGIAVLLDAGGNDRYTAADHAQGAALFGFGALIDLGGADAYVAGAMAQGAALFGVGLLADGGGDDTFYVLGDGQGFGGTGGVGVLADVAGSDTYVAEPDPIKSRRPSYHSELKVSVSNAQGVGSGRRGDGADGHAWAGGLGALVDLAGNDRYTSGNWSQGTGYWFGTGLLVDGAGADVYTGCWWSQAAGAHFAIGVLVDEAGDDAYAVTSDGHNSLAFGHDFSAVVFLDQAGNDTYAPLTDGLGFSINRSVAVFVDAAGGDSYALPTGAVPGGARYDPKLDAGEAHYTFFAETPSLGLFLDLGGKDQYGDGARDGTTWGDAADSDNVRIKNPGLGADVEGGTIEWGPAARR